MALETLRVPRINGIARSIAGLVAAEGSAPHPHRRLLLSPAAPMRDLSDALHALCMLHGGHPGILDHALAGGRESAASVWLDAASAAFKTERHRLATLVAAAGPLPSTPGQAESESAVAAQRHALDMLGRSDRVGCSAGAAAALLLDWAQAIAPLLVIATERLGVSDPAGALPDEMKTAAAIDALADRPAVERAALFGAQQLLAQQRGLWDLLEARASARNAA